MVETLAAAGAIACLVAAIPTIENYAVRIIRFMARTEAMPTNESSLPKWKKPKGWNHADREGPTTTRRNCGETAPLETTTNDR